MDNYYMWEKDPAEKENGLSGPGELKNAMLQIQGIDKQIRGELTFLREQLKAREGPCRQCFKYAEEVEMYKLVLDQLRKSEVVLKARIDELEKKLKKVNEVLAKRQAHLDEEQRIQNQRVQSSILRLNSIDKEIAQKAINLQCMQQELDMLVSRQQQERQRNKKIGLQEANEEIEQRIKAKQEEMEHICGRLTQEMNILQQSLRHSQRELNESHQRIDLLLQNLQASHISLANTKEALAQAHLSLKALESQYSQLSHRYSSLQASFHSLEATLNDQRESKAHMLHQFKIHQEIRELEKKNLKMQSDMRMEMRNKISRQCDSLKQENSRIQKQLEYFLERLTQFQATVEALKRKLRWVQGKVDPSTLTLTLTSEEFYTHIVLEEKSDDEFAIPEMNFHKSEKEQLKVSLLLMQQKYAELERFQREATLMLGTYSAKIAQLEVAFGRKLEEMRAIQQENLHLTENIQKLRQLLLESNTKQDCLQQQNEKLKKSLITMNASFKGKIAQYQTLLQAYQTQSEQIEMLAESQHIDHANDTIPESEKEEGGYDRVQFQKNYSSVEKEYNVSASQRMREYQLKFFKRDIHNMLIDAFGKEVELTQHFKETEEACAQIFAFKERENICKILFKIFVALKMALSFPHHPQHDTHSLSSNSSYAAQQSLHLKAPREQHLQQEEYINDNNQIKMDPNQMSNLLLCRNLQEAISQAEAEEILSDAPASNDNNSTHRSPGDYRLQSLSARSAETPLKMHRNALKNNNLLLKLKLKR